QGSQYSQQDGRPKQQLVSSLNRKIQILLFLGKPLVFEFLFLGLVLDKQFLADLLSVVVEHGLVGLIFCQQVFVGGFVVVLAQGGLGEKFGGNRNIKM